MKLREEKRQIQSNLVGDKSFQIKADAKAFRILSDKLYSNKIKATIRELSTNAYDSHVDSEQPERPFLVQLPNHLQPTFAVEDFGTGMEEEKVLNLYSTYFDSDKIESNTVVGALGLGSKSPFAYTDTFTVVSKHKGTKSVYTCFLNEEEVPSILKIGSEPTREENGLRVEFAVQEKDFNRFADEAKKVLRPFKIKPIIKGAEIEIYQYPDPIIKKDGWKIFSKKYRYGYTCDLYDSVAVQGNIEYPIQINEVKNDKERIVEKYKISSEEFDKVLDIFNKVLFVVYFPLGTLGFAPSREHLEYNKFTNDAIFTRLWNVRQELYEEIKYTFRSVDSVLDLVFKYQEISSNFSYLKDSDLLELSVDDKGSTLYDVISLQDFEYEKDYEIYDFEESSNRVDIKCFKVKKRYGYKEDNNFYDFFSSKDNRSKVRVIYHDEQFEESKKRSGIYRVKQHIRADEFKAIIVYNKNIFNRLNEKNYELVSSYGYLKKPGRKGSSTVSNDTDTVYIHKAVVGIVDGEPVLKWEKGEKQIKDLVQDTEFINDPNKIYVTKFHNKYKCEGVSGKEIEMDGMDIRKEVKNLYTLEKYANFPYKLGDEVIKLYIMRKQYFAKKELKEYNWKPLNHMLHNRFDKVLSNENVKDYIKEAYKMDQHNIIPRDVKNVAYIVNETKLKDCEKRLYKLTSKISTNREISNRRSYILSKYELRELLLKYNVEFVKELEKDFGEKLYTLIKKVYNDIMEKRYPMIKVIPISGIWSDYLEENREKINSYVELITNK